MEDKLDNVTRHLSHINFNTVTNTQLSVNSKGSQYIDKSN